MHFNQINSIENKPTVSIICKDGRLKVFFFLLRSQIKVCPFPSLPFSIREVLFWEISQGKIK